MFHLKNKRTMKKRIIWSNDYDATREENWRDSFEEWCEDNGLDKEEEDIDDFINETLSNYLYDERANLKKQTKQIDTIKANVDVFLSLGSDAEVTKIRISQLE